MFLELNRVIREEVVTLLFHAQVEPGEASEQGALPPASPNGDPRAVLLMRLAESSGNTVACRTARNLRRAGTELLQDLPNLDFGLAAITLAYALTLVYALAAWRRSHDDPLLAALPLVSLVGGLALVPIVVTSDVWSDFSITFLLWWAAGFTVSLARAEPDEVRQSRLGPARASA